ncbi:hornerin-like [Sycon ciliatum]|uniref:hornerin-like n=1 Tax=Sycon ciliatum TaxID=27933 RepID=UPI0031F70C90
MLSVQSFDALEETVLKKLEQFVCPVRGWDAWSSWSQCSSSCGGGIQRRSRECGSNESSLCVGESRQQRKCGSVACPSTRKEGGCVERGGVLDVAFILDASGSVGDGNFAKMVSFTKKMMDRFSVATNRGEDGRSAWRRQQLSNISSSGSSDSGGGGSSSSSSSSSSNNWRNDRSGTGTVGRSQSRFGVLRYNNSANVVFGFDMYLNLSSVLSAMDGMAKVTKGCTNTSGALEVAGIDLFGLSMSCTSLGCHRNSSCRSYCGSASGSSGSSSRGSGGGSSSQNGRGSGGSSSGSSSSSSGRGSSSSSRGSSSSSRGSSSSSSSSGSSSSGDQGRGRGRRSSSSGSRRREVIVVLSDGNSNVGGNPSACASELRANNIEVFAVGIGNGIDRSELESIASLPYPKHVLSVQSFDALEETVLKKLEQFVCPVRGWDVWSSWSQCSSSCGSGIQRRSRECGSNESSLCVGESRQQRKCGSVACPSTRKEGGCVERGGVLDVAFILDASGSVGDGNFAKMVSFTKKMMDLFSVATNRGEDGRSAWRRQQLSNISRSGSSDSGGGGGSSSSSSRSNNWRNDSSGTGAVGRSQSRFGVLRYNNSANVVFGFDMYLNLSSVLSAMDGMAKVTKGCTNTSGALEVAGIDLFGLSMSCTSLGCHRNSSCRSYCGSASGSSGSSSRGSGGGSSSQNGRGSGGSSSGSSSSSGRGSSSSSSSRGSSSSSSSSGSSSSGYRGRGRGRRSSSSGGRRREVIVLLSDGNSNVGGNPSACASELRANNIEVFALGIGNGIDRSELESIASLPYPKHVLSVQSFDALEETVLKKLEQFVCPVRGWDVWSSWSQCSSSCGGGIQRRSRECGSNESSLCVGESRQQRKCGSVDCPSTRKEGGCVERGGVLDVAFILDASGSVGDGNFAKMVSFTKKMMDRFSVATNRGEDGRSAWRRQQLSNISSSFSSDSGGGGGSSSSSSNNWRNDSSGTGAVGRSQSRFGVLRYNNSANVVFGFDMYLNLSSVLSAMDGMAKVTKGCTNTSGALEVAGIDLFGLSMSCTSLGCHRNSSCRSYCGSASGSSGSSSRGNGGGSSSQNGRGSGGSSSGSSSSSSGRGSSSSSSSSRGSSSSSSRGSSSSSSSSSSGSSSSGDRGRGRGRRSSSSGGRRREVIVVLSDGNSNVGGNPSACASELRANNIEVFAVGIGNGIDRSELESIASLPYPKHVLSVQSFDALEETVLKKLEQFVCPVRGWDVWSSWSQCSSSCGGGIQRRSRECGSNESSLCVGESRQQRKCGSVDCPSTRKEGGCVERGGVLDVAFILDASGSVGDGNFAKMVSFTKKMMDRFSVATNRGEDGRSAWRRQQLSNISSSFSSDSGGGGGSSSSSSNNWRNDSSGTGAVGRSQSRFGVLRYNNSANVVFGFDMYLNLSSVLSAMDGMAKVTKGCTNTSGALEVAGIDLFGLSMSCTSLGCHRNSSCRSYCGSASGSSGSSSRGNGGGSSSQNGRGSGGSSSGSSSSSSGRGSSSSSSSRGSSSSSSRGSSSSSSSSGSSSSGDRGRGRGRRSSSSGGRRREVIVVLSDGNSNVGGNPSACASELRANNIEVFAVGIGNGIDRSELESIASLPYPKHVLSVQSFDALEETVLKKLEQFVCPVRGWDVWSSWSQCSSSCGGGIQRRSRECRSNESSLCVGESRQQRKCGSVACPSTRKEGGCVERGGVLDVAFILDASGSVGDGNFAKMVSFTKKMMDRFSVATYRGEDGRSAWRRQQLSNISSSGSSGGGSSSSGSLIAGVHPAAAGAATVAVEVEVVVRMAEEAAEAAVAAAAAVAAVAAAAAAAAAVGAAAAAAAAAAQGRHLLVIEDEDEEEGAAQAFVAGMYGVAGRSAVPAVAAGYREEVENAEAMRAVCVWERAGNSARGCVERGGVLDVAFILDASGSVGDGNFAKMVSFTKKMMDRFSVATNRGEDGRSAWRRQQLSNISSSGSSDSGGGGGSSSSGSNNWRNDSSGTGAVGRSQSRFGVLRYNNSANVVFGFDMYLNLSSVLSAMDGMAKVTIGCTNTSGALEVAGIDLFGLSMSCTSLGCHRNSSCRSYCGSASGSSGSSSRGSGGGSSSQNGRGSGGSSSSSSSSSNGRGSSSSSRGSSSSSSSSGSSSSGDRGRGRGRRSSSSGGRRREVIVVLSDGNSNVGGNPSACASELRANNIEVFAVGIGNGIDRSELESIASLPYPKHVLSVQSFDALEETVLKKLEQFVCPVRGWDVWSSWSQCSSSCGGGIQRRSRECGSNESSLCVGESRQQRKCGSVACPSTRKEGGCVERGGVLDVAFILDASGSVGDGNFAKMVSFTKKMMDLFSVATNRGEDGRSAWRRQQLSNISSSGSSDSGGGGGSSSSSSNSWRNDSSGTGAVGRSQSRFGVLRYNNSANVVFGFDMYLNLSSVLSAMDGMVKVTKGCTNTSGALEVAGIDLFGLSMSCTSLGCHRNSSCRSYCGSASGSSGSSSRGSGGGSSSQNGRGSGGSSSGSSSSSGRGSSSSSSSSSRGSSSSSSNSGSSSSGYRGRGRGRRSSSSGGRRREVIVLLSDGNSNVGGNPSACASELRANNIEVFAVGIGNGIDRSELESIASLPYPKHVLSVQSFDALEETVLKKLEQFVCPVRGWDVWSSWSQCSSSCGGGIQRRSRECGSNESSLCVGESRQQRKCGSVACPSIRKEGGCVERGGVLDVAFILDASGSVGDGNFAKMVSFTKKMMDRFSVATNRGEDGRSAWRRQQLSNISSSFSSDSGGGGGRSSSSSNNWRNDSSGTGAVGRSQSRFGVLRYNNSANVVFGFDMYLNLSSVLSAMDGMAKVTKGCTNTSGALEVAGIDLFGLSMSCTSLGCHRNSSCRSYCGSASGSSGSSSRGSGGGSSSQNGRGSGGSSSGSSSSSGRGSSSSSSSSSRGSSSSSSSSGSSSSGYRGRGRGRRSSSSGGRRREVIVLLSDGNSNVGGNPSACASELRANNIEVFAVGIGNGIDRSELESIASLPYPKHVLSVQSFDALEETVLKKLEQFVCPVRGWDVWSSWSQCSSSCGGGIQRRSRECGSNESSLCVGESRQQRKCGSVACPSIRKEGGCVERGGVLDVAFILDASGSVGDGNFAKMVSFTKKMMDRFSVATNRGEDGRSAWRRQQLSNISSSFSSDSGGGGGRSSSSSNNWRNDSSGTGAVGRSQSRFGVLRYNNSANVVFGFDMYLNLSSVLSAMDGMAKVTKGCTNTSGALEVAGIDLFGLSMSCTSLGCHRNSSCRSYCGSASGSSGSSSRGSGAGSSSQNGRGSGGSSSGSSSSGRGSSSSSRGSSSSSSSSSGSSSSGYRGRGRGRRSSSSGGRRREVIVLLSDGNSNVGGNPSACASELRANNIEVFAVGIGNGIDRSELESIASLPYPKHVLSVQSFDALEETVLKKLEQFVCPVRGWDVWSSWSQCSSSCGSGIQRRSRECGSNESSLCVGESRQQRKCGSVACPSTRKEGGCVERGGVLDVAFILDASGSVGDGNFAKMVSFTKKMMDRFSVAKNRGEDGRSAWRRQQLSNISSSGSSDSGGGGGSSSNNWRNDSSGTGAVGRSQSRFGVLRYNNSANVVFGFDMYLNLSSVLSAMDGMAKVTKGCTNTSGALEVAGIDLFGLSMSCTSLGCHRNSSCRSYCGSASGSSGSSSRGSGGGSSSQNGRGSGGSSSGSSSSSSSSSSGRGSSSSSRGSSSSSSSGSSSSGYRGRGRGRRSSSSGGRRREVIVLLSDGNSNVGGNPSACASELRANHIEVFAVGIGNGIDRSELESIASLPYPKHVLSVQSFDALEETVLKKLEQFVCPVRGWDVWSSWSQCSSSCGSGIQRRSRECGSNESSLCVGESRQQRKCGSVACPSTRKEGGCVERGGVLDVAFILDASGSVGDGNFAKMVSFTKKMMDRFSVAKNRGEDGRSAWRRQQLSNISSSGSSDSGGGGGSSSLIAGVHPAAAEAAAVAVEVEVVVRMAEEAAEAAVAAAAAAAAAAVAAVAAAAAAVVAAAAAAQGRHLLVIEDEDEEEGAAQAVAEDEKLFSWLGCME